MNNNRLTALLLTLAMALMLAISPFAHAFANGTALPLADEDVLPITAQDQPLQSHIQQQLESLAPHEDELAQDLVELEPDPGLPPVEVTPPAEHDLPSGGGQSAEESPSVDLPPSDQNQLIILPPTNTGVPKPQKEIDAQPKDGATLHDVTFIYMNADGTEAPHYIVAVNEGLGAEAPVPPPAYTLGGKIFEFIGWDSSFNSIYMPTTVRARYRELTNYNPAIDEYFLYGYSGKPGKKVQLAFPVRLNKLDDPLSFFYSNQFADGVQLMQYDKKVTPDRMDQSFYQQLGIQMMQVLIDTKEIDEMPFTPKSVVTANAQRHLPYVVQPFSGDPAYYTGHGFRDGSICNGFAVFDLTVASSAKNGSYEIPLILSWVDGEGQHELEFEAHITVSGQKTSSGSSSSGGTGTPSEPKPIPRPHLYIESVRTEPENPKAGDTFDVILTMVNTSKTLYLHNMLLEYDTADDMLRPANEVTNLIWIPKMAANTKREERIRVISLPDIPSKLVKMSVSIQYQDSKYADGSTQQEITVPVLPIQRMKVDDPTMSSNNMVSIDQEYEIEIAVANEGKTPLFNLTAKVTSANGDLIPGTTFHGGKLEPNESKKIVLTPSGRTDGDYPCKAIITYENDAGDVSEPVEKEFEFTVIPDEDFGYDDGLIEPIDFTPPEPEAPVAMQVMQSLPWQAYAVVAGLLLLIIVAMTVNARLRRKRAMEDDEMD